LYRKKTGLLFGHVSKKMLENRSPRVSKGNNPPLLTRGLLPDSILFVTRPFILTDFGFDSAEHFTFLR